MIIETLQRRRKLSTQRKYVYALKNLKAELVDFFFLTKNCFACKYY